MPIFYNRINASLGYRAFVNFLGGAKKEQINFFQSVYAQLALDISGAAHIGVEYAHPIEKNVKMGKFNLILDINF